jgi:hypothetical protein
MCAVFRLLTACKYECGLGLAAERCVFESQRCANQVLLFTSYPIQKAGESSAIGFTPNANSTAVTQCSYPYFDAISACSHGMPETQESMYKSCFLMGLDGNSFSGCYYTLSQSNSNVVRQKAYHERHDTRLMALGDYVQSV